jgi:hypothetical protein
MSEIVNSRNVSVKVVNLYTYSLIRPMGMTVSNKNSIHKVITSRMNSINGCYVAVHSLLSSRLPSKSAKIKIHKTIALPAVYYWVIISVSFEGV